MNLVVVLVLLYACEVWGYENIDFIYGTCPFQIFVMKKLDDILCIKQFLLEWFHSEPIWLLFFLKNLHANEANQPKTSARFCVY